MLQAGQPYHFFSSNPFQLRVADSLEGCSEIYMNLALKRGAAFRKSVVYTQQTPSRFQSHAETVTNAQRVKDRRLVDLCHRSQIDEHEDS